MIQFTLAGSIPSKKNNKQIVYRHGSASLRSSDAYLEWHEGMIYDNALRKVRKIKGPIEGITLSFYAESNRKADLTNKAESIMDLLVDMKILEDDNFFIVPRVVLIFGGVDKNNPRTLVTIEEM